MPALSQPGLRFGLLAAAVTVWIAWTLIMASRVTSASSPRPTERQRQRPPRPAMRCFSPSFWPPFIPYVIGVLRYDWGFNELSGLFLVAAFGVGLVSGRNLSETPVDFLKAMEVMLAAALFVWVFPGMRR